MGLFSSIFGGDSGAKASKSQNAYYEAAARAALEQSALARDMFGLTKQGFDRSTEIYNQGSPLRKSLLASYNATDQNAFKPVTMANITQSPMYRAVLSTVGNQYNQARNQAFEDAPGARFSGALSDKLGDVSAARADAMTSGTAQIAQSEMQRRMQLLSNASNFSAGQPTAAPPVGDAAGAMGSAASTFSGIGNAQGQMAQAQSAQAGQMGLGLGTLAALTFGGK